MNYIAVLAMIACSVFRFIDFGKAIGDLFFYMLTFYLIGFAALLFCAEVRIGNLLVYVEFLDSRLGKGAYILFVGMLMFDETRLRDIAFALYVVLTGIFNIILGCQKDQTFEDEYKSEKGEYDEAYEIEDDKEKMRLYT